MVSEAPSALGPVKRSSPSSLAPEAALVSLDLRDASETDLGQVA